MIVVADEAADIICAGNTAHHIRVVNSRIPRESDEAADKVTSSHINIYKAYICYISPI